MKGQELKKKNLKIKTYILFYELNYDFNKLVNKLE